MPAAARTCVSFANFSQIGEARLEVTAGLDAAQMPVVPIRPYDVLALAKRLVSDHLDRGADGPDRAALGAERLSNLGLLGRSEVLAERRQQLHLVEAIIA